MDDLNSYCFRKPALIPDGNQLFDFCKKIFQKKDLLAKKLKVEQPEGRPLWKKFQENVFFKDIEKDAKFYGLEETQIEKMKNWYSLNNFVSVGWSGFILVNWGRALHFLCYNTKFFENISSEQMLGFFPLTTYDPYFIMPIITFLFNYIAISGSKHPFLIHFNQNENFIRRFNRIFVLSLPAVFFPTAYLVSWCSFLAVHIALRKFQQIKENREQKVILDKYTINPRKIQEIEEYYRRVVLKQKPKKDD